MRHRAKTTGVVTTLAFLASVVAVHAQEPWGYLFELRTLRLHAMVAEVVRVGRSSSSNVILTHPMVSRRHAEIRREADGASFRDVRSTNGSRLNREPVRPGRSIALQDGDLLELARDKLLYHQSLDGLREVALRHSLLARFAALRVPVIRDRMVVSLGREKQVTGFTRVSIEEESGGIELTFSEERVSAFQPGENVFIGRVRVAEGELRLSVWGLAEREGIVSRRASFSQTEHGELRVGLSASTPEEARRRFDDGWNRRGLSFLLPLVSRCMDVFSEEQSTANGIKLMRSLAERGGEPALRDATHTLGFLHRLHPNEPELALLAARAGARWVKMVARANRKGLEGDVRLELASALERTKAWARKAGELGAKAQDTEALAHEISEAEQVLSEVL